MTDTVSARKGMVPLVLLAALRMAIGWHFLYEGLVKLADPAWTSAGYLRQSQWFLGGLFNWIADTPAVLQVVDALNMWGLVLIGAGLILGLFSRTSAVAGVLLLALYYVANPSLITLTNTAQAEGSYLFIDKNLVELCALLAVACSRSGMAVGLDGLIAYLRSRKAAPEAGGAPATADGVPRRAFVRHLAGLPVAGGLAVAFQRKHGWVSFEEKHLLGARVVADDADAMSGATIKTYKFASLDDLKGQVPHAEIKGLRLSRLMLGGNLIGGWAHARDLIYVSKLVKAYHHDAKVFETFRLAEQCGINTIMTNPLLCRVINDYWQKEGGSIQFISDCSYNGDLSEGIARSVDAGAHSCYVQGGIADRLVAKGDLDPIAKGLERIREHGLTAGLGAHKLSTVQECIRYGMKPDYWMKTLHQTDYWSANKEDQHDNIWCETPDETIAFMEGLEEPWIAFKVLAAGAYHPNVGFSYALKGGADFLCVGMYDFQIVEDVNLFLDAYRDGAIERGRPWRA
ncbi:MAG: DoxX family protein [Candidatus Hydrogenedentes bacterium]|nr:DoxX family protein [Candidatus Hydrogenedentota bacterium]